MGIVMPPFASPVYLDTNVFVYAVEGFAAFAETLRGMFADIDGGRLRAVTSELTLAEVLVHPLRAGDRERERVFHAFLQPREGLRVVSVSREILVASARLRASLGLRLPDAIHVATAAHTGCALMVTNDKGIRVPPDMRVVGLADAWR